MKFWILLLTATQLQAGTLIVTYHTGPQAERLGQVRFWLTDADEKQTMYPQDDIFVDDPKEKTRMVVIEDLAPGDYTLKFLMPNQDHFFEESPPQKITLTDDVLRIDHEIKRS